MEENPVFQNTNYKIYLDSEYKILRISAFGIPKSEIAKDAWMKALELARENQILKWLGDDLHLESLHPEVTRWWTNEWYPLAIKTLTYKGKRYSATVLSHRFYAEMSSKIAVNDMLQQQKNIKYGVETMEQRFFQDLLSAEEWLKSID